MCADMLECTCACRYPYMGSSFYVCVQSTLDIFRNNSGADCNAPSVSSADGQPSVLHAMSGVLYCDEYVYLNGNIVVCFE